MISSSLYPIKYLNEFFVPSNSSLETNILLTSMSCILNSFFLIKNIFVHFFVLKIYFLPIHSYSLLKRNVKIFIQN